MVYTETNQDELIVEYEPIFPEKLSITNNPCATAGYVIHILKDTWVFPWKYKKVLVNINKIFIPYQTVGIIHGFTQEKYKVQTLFISDGTLKYIKIKSRFIPRKLKAPNAYAALDIVPSYECHIVKTETKNN